MRKTVLFISITLSIFIVVGCQDKAEKVKEAEQKETVKVETEKKDSVQYPRSGVELKKWIDDAEKRADKDILKKLEEFTNKFSAGEIIRGTAVRSKPDYWDKVSAEEQLKTLSIMNTAFSKARIEAGYAENLEVLNSTMYMEDESEKIIAVSDSMRGTQIL